MGVRFFVTVKRTLAGPVRRALESGHRGNALLG
jgi:hypothetical protein